MSIFILTLLIAAYASGNPKTTTTPFATLDMKTTDASEEVPKVIKTTAASAEGLPGWAIILIIIIAVLLVGVAGYFSMQYSIMIVEVKKTEAESKIIQMAKMIGESDI